MEDPSQRGERMGESVQMYHAPAADEITFSTHTSSCIPTSCLPTPSRPRSRLSRRRPNSRQQQHPDMAEKNSTNQQGSENESKSQRPQSPSSPRPSAPTSTVGDAERLQWKKGNFLIEVVRQLEQESEHYERQLSELRSENSALKAEVTSLWKEINLTHELKNEVSALRKDGTNSTAPLREELDVVKTRNSSLQSEITDLTEKNRRLAEEGSALKENLRRLEQTVTEKSKEPDVPPEVQEKLKSFDAVERRLQHLEHLLTGGPSPFPDDTFYTFRPSTSGTGGASGGGGMLGVGKTSVDSSRATSEYFTGGDATKGSPNPKTPRGIDTSKAGHKDGKEGKGGLVSGLVSPSKSAKYKRVLRPTGLVPNWPGSANSEKNRDGDRKDSGAA
ncbi:hypothetical protein IWZ03DRAFT_134036 [Phyllosticta citriasiana]|uniref:Uncharacterized protein n=1 Tax=Phyllosticta citriasiana TaxID=595635 RepID=A0ABR1KUP5_9PEZI